MNNKEQIIDYNSYQFNFKNLINKFIKNTLKMKKNSFCK